MATAAANAVFAKGFSGFLTPLTLNTEILAKPLHWENGDEEIRVWPNGGGALQTADELRQGINWEDFILEFWAVDTDTSVQVPLNPSGAFELPQLEEDMAYTVRLIVKTTK